MFMRFCFKQILIQVLNLSLNLYTYDNCYNYSGSFDEHIAEHVAYSQTKLISYLGFDSYIYFINDVLILSFKLKKLHLNN